MENGNPFNREDVCFVVSINYLPDDIEQSAGMLYNRDEHRTVGDSYRAYDRQ